MLNVILPGMMMENNNTKFIVYVNGQKINTMDGLNKLEAQDVEETSTSFLPCKHLSSTITYTLDVRCYYVQGIKKSINKIWGLINARQLCWRSISESKKKFPTLLCNKQNRHYINVRNRL